MNEDITMNEEQMNLVVVGHVDHGKSTVIGRLLADTNTLPEGKLEQIKKYCEDNSRPFEYAFLLDALQNEQKQGITIDAARCFFKTDLRKYIIIDAPGHIEFLKNMITGASRAEAALLVIDAEEGIKENSRRHGYMASLLGIKQIVVVVNKIDLINYDKKRYDDIKKEYEEFLKEIKIDPMAFVPISARDGDNIANVSTNTPWYDGKSVVELIDTFSKNSSNVDKSFRMPVQDIYKFTNENDDRRLVVGTVETGSISVGDDVCFLPSNKKAKIKTIEEFNNDDRVKAETGESPGFTLDPEIYIKPGEIMYRENEKAPFVSSSFKATIFWMSRKSMIKNRQYKIKIGTNRATVYLKDIINVLDASDLTTEKNKEQIDRYDVAECVLQTLKPISFDLGDDILEMARFVIVDDYEISGGGIITEALTEEQDFINTYINHRNYAWDKGMISGAERVARYNQNPKFIVISGDSKDEGTIQRKVAKKLEKDLFEAQRNVYYLGIANILSGIDFDLKTNFEARDEQIRRLGEIAHTFTEAGLIFISTITDLDQFEIDILKKLNEPNDILVINIGNENLKDSGLVKNIYKDNTGEYNLAEITKTIQMWLKEENILLEYYL